jgi:gamma-glutamyltranspeptidase/glutathione hydrolase/leukotriene-C4 hydrolase
VPAPKAVNGSLGLHRMVEAFKHAFAARSHLGDPDLVPGVRAVLSRMLNTTIAAELRERIDDSRTFPPPYYTSM